MSFITAQSFGAGVQSVALLYMALNGHVPRPDVVIFADTGCEPAHAYEIVRRDRKECMKQGIPFHTVRRSNLAVTAFEESGQVRVPLFTLDPNGKKGMLFRTCTDRHKIEPIRRELRLLGARKAELWLGMTTDEITRVKPSRLKWITNRYPLVDLGLSRSDCETFLAEHGIEAAKSACVFCPYRSAAMWQAVRSVPADWKAAVAYDESIRNVRPGFKCFVHSSRTPLKDAVLGSGVSLFDDECAGVCAA